MWTRKFWKDATERAARTAAQVVTPLVVGNGTNIFSLNWKEVAGITAAAVLGSYGMSLLASFKDNRESASLVDPVGDTGPGKHDGSQSAYDPATEGYTDAPGTDAELATLEVEQDAHFQNLTPYQAAAQGHPLPPGHTRRRDPSTGRFLPRPSDMVDVHGESAYKDGKPL